MLVDICKSYQSSYYRPRFLMIGWPGYLKTDSRFSHWCVLPHFYICKSVKHLPQLHLLIYIIS